MSHTILLLQPNIRIETRIYYDFNSLFDCIEGVRSVFEEHLKRKNSNLPTIKYELSELFDFLDELADISVLVHQKSTNLYAPYNREWIKEKLYVMLKYPATWSA